jgi:1-acyl-sn-glycerol-3-phosphate acyltransferase
MGWKMIGSWPAGVKKAVMIVVPHTSWHDFYIGLMVRRILGVDIKYVAKKELFKPPFGWYFRWMGGTRKKVKDWKTGFYYIAKTANVPIVMLALDFGRKQVKISEPLYVTEDKEQDFKKIKTFYKDVIGKVAHYT